MNVALLTRVPELPAVNAPADQLTVVLLMIARPSKVWLAVVVMLIVLAEVNVGTERVAPRPVVT